MRALIVALLPLVAGCLGPGAAPPAADGDPAPLIPSENLAFESCVGVAMWLIGPGTTHPPHMPEAFHPRPGLAGSAHLEIAAVSCPRVVLADRVLDGGFLAWAFVAVEANNESWESPGMPSQWGLGALVDRPALAAPLERAGLPVQVAEFHRVTNGATESWTFGAASPCRIQFDTTNLDPREDTLRRHVWTGGPDFARVDLAHRANRTAFASAAIAETTCLPLLREAIGAATAPAAGLVLVDLTLTLPTTPTRFR